MKSDYKRKKRIVEIYFVLYLAALVFLIPNAKDVKNQNNDTANSFELFAIKPEKAALFCKLTVDSAGVKVITLDSINNIFYSGEVRDVNFEFYVEDQSVKQKINISNNDNNKYFKVVQFSKENYAKFSWTPPIQDKSNRTYLVQAIATAKLKNTGNVVKAKAQFTLVINYYENNIPDVRNKDLTNTNMFQTIPNWGQPTQPLGDINLKATKDPVNTIAYEEWENEIFIIGGINNTVDLSKNTQVVIYHEPENNGGSAYIVNYYNNAITIKGKAPGFGSLKVKLILTRKSDGKEASIFFTVVPQAVGNPEYPSVMYPGLNYVFKPNLPFSSGLNSFAGLKENDKIRAQNAQGGDFAFTPNIQDTGKYFTFERYLNNNLYGQKYKILVRSFPSPEIQRMQKSRDNAVTLQTVSFGYHLGKENLVDRLEIQGNAVYSEKYGQFLPNKKNSNWVQTFEIAPKDPNKSFEFKIRAVDKRGWKSEDKVFKND